MPHRTAPRTPFLDRTAMSTRARTVTIMGMTVAQLTLALLNRLKEPRVTPVLASFATRPTFCRPRNAMNRPMPAGMALRTASGMAVKIFLRRPVMVSRMKMRPSTRTNTRALAEVKPKPTQTV